MSLIVQPSLFGSSGKLGVADLGAAVERRRLSEGAWIDLRLGFVTHAIPKTARCLGARISVQFRPDWGDQLS